MTEDGKTTFAWRDGPVLKSIKENAWILLDEVLIAFVFYNFILDESCFTNGFRRFKFVF